MFKRRNGICIKMSTIVTQEEEMIKKSKSQSIRWLLNSSHNGKKYTKRMKGNNNFRKKKDGKSRLKTEGFKGKYNFFQKTRYKQANCDEFINWFVKEGTPLAQVYFESNTIDVPSNTSWFDVSTTIYVTNSLHEFRKSWKPNDGN